MKTLLFFIFIALLMGMFGCGGTKKVTEQSKTESKQLEDKPPIPFKESYVKGVNYYWQDSLLFFNSCQVIIKGSLIKKRSFIKNGRLYDRDTLIKILKTIEIDKAGHIFEPVKKDKNGIANIIPVSFSQKDETYQLSFFREDFIKNSDVKNSGSFVLNGKAILIFEGKKYPVVATIDSKEGEDRLLFYHDKEITSREINESAEGWNSGSNNNNYQNQYKNKKEENNDSFHFQEYTPPNK